MKRLLVSVVLIISSLFFLIRCDKGIEPNPVDDSGETGFSGLVTFKGEWPAGVTRTHLVVFRNPLVSAGDFSVENIGFISNEITYGSSEFQYNSIDNSISTLITLAPGEYSYIVVAQSYTPDLSLDRKDWVVVGVYTATGDQNDPGKMIINKGHVTSGVNITVDFNNPPPQPPGGN